MSKIERPAVTQPLAGSGRRSGSGTPSDASRSPAGGTDSLHVSVNAEVVLKNGKPAVEIDPVQVSGSPLDAGETAKLQSMSARVRHAVLEQVVGAVIQQVDAQIRQVISGAIARGLAQNKIPADEARKMADQVVAGSMPDIDKAIAARVSEQLSSRQP